MKQVSLLSVAVKKYNGEAYSLLPLTGVPTLTSLDDQCYYRENYENALSLLGELDDSFSTLNEEISSVLNGIPNIKIQRACYNEIILLLASFFDFSRRLKQLLEKEKYDVFHYYGIFDWRSELVKSECLNAGVRFQLHTPLKVALKESVRSLYYRFRELLVSRRRQHDGEPCDFLCVTNASRFSMGLPDVFKKLNGRVQVVSSLAEKSSIFLNPLPFEVYSYGSQSIAARLFRLVLSRDIPLNDGVVDPPMRRLLAEAVKAATPRIVSFSRLLDEFPQAEVLGTPVGEEYLEIARSKGRRVTVIQTCATGEYLLHLFGEGRYLLASGADKENMVKWGMSPDSIHIVGYPHYCLPEAQEIELNTSRVREKYSLNEEPLILFVGNYATSAVVEIEYLEKLSRRFYRAFAKSKTGVAIVKLHPYDYQFDEHFIWAKESGVQMERLHIVKDESIQPLLQGCDLLVMSQSTVGQEAILLDKPIIDMPLTYDIFGYQQYGAVVVAKDDYSMEELMFKILSGDNIVEKLASGRKKFCENYMHMQDGNACNRIAEILSSKDN